MALLMTIPKVGHQKNFMPIMGLIVDWKAWKIATCIAGVAVLQYKNPYYVMEITVSVMVKDLIKKLDTIICIFHPVPYFSKLLYFSSKSWFFFFYTGQIIVYYNLLMLIISWVSSRSFASPWYNPFFSFV